MFLRNLTDGAQPTKRMRASLKVIRQSLMRRPREPGLWFEPAARTFVLSSVRISAIADTRFMLIADTVSR